MRNTGIETAKAIAVVTFPLTHVICPTWQMLHPLVLSQAYLQEQDNRLVPDILQALKLGDSYYILR